MERPRVSIIVPALNEAATIFNIVVAVRKYGTPIVVDDGSTDHTAALALSAGAIVVSHNKNYGYDAALNSGFKKAVELGCEIIATIDADGQHDSSLLNKFIDQIDTGADVVVGIRNRKQRFAEHIFAWLTALYFGIKDPLCGMKLYRVEVYKALGHFDSYGSIGTELMIFALKNRFSVSQVPFVVRDRKDQPRFGQIFIGNYKIIRAILMMWCKKY